MADSTSHPADEPGPSSQPSKIPEMTFLTFHLLCMNDSDSTAFNTAATKFYPELPSHFKITHHNCALKYVPQETRFDAVVSPANSYARLDGAFDDALARAYGPPNDYGWITRKAQKVVYEKWRGFAPPGTCTIVPLGDDNTGEQQAWETKYLLLCPTMRVPQDVNWDREVVYECIWSLLCAVDNHNRETKRRSTSSTSLDTEIKSILMTPLATGAGQVSPQRWAEQTVLAMKHWVAAVEKPEVWAKADWNDAFKQTWEVARTHKGKATIASFLGGSSGAK